MRRRILPILFMLCFTSSVSATGSVVITGFEPFGKHHENPSWQAVQALPDYINGKQIIKLKLPVVFATAYDKIANAINDYTPELVIAVGLNPASKNINLERVAINIDDAEISDNAGQKPVDEIINDTGNNAYFTKLPIKKIKQELANINITSKISNTAGTYVCNHVMYKLMHDLHSNHSNILGGFIHVPDSSNLAITEQTRALEAIINSMI